MAIHKAKVVGPVPVGDVDPGGTVTLDDVQVNVLALVEAGHVELIAEPSGTKADLVAQAEALGLDTEGTKADLVDRIREAQEAG